MPRLERVNALIKEEISQILLKEIDLESGVLVTVIDTKTSIDLQQVTILISVFPTEKSDLVIKKIRVRAPYLRSLLNKKVQMRYVPHLRFDLAGK